MVAVELLAASTYEIMKSIPSTMCALIKKASLTRKDAFATIRTTVY
jgi:hypothetical protein